MRRLLLLLLLVSGLPAQELYEVRFRFPARRDVERVAVAGDFNAWDSGADPLERRRDGSWQVTLELTPGFYAYKFVLDGERWEPDPAARQSRPDGHGGQNSVLAVGPIEREARRFESPEWLGDAVAYQIFPERFCDGDASNNPRGTQAWGGRPEFGNHFGGDLDGIVARLDHLQALGVSVLYLNPIYFAPSNHKYNPRDHRQVDPAFGGDEALTRLCAALEERGMRVVLDGVFNHTSTDFFAFADCRARGADSPYWDWYFIEGDAVRDNPPNYRCWSGHDGLPELNTDHPDVRAYLFDSVRLWHERFPIAGWRLDTVTDIEHPFWEEFRAVVKDCDEDAWLIGEIWGDPWPWLQGDEFDGATNYRFRDAVLQGVLQRSFDVRELDARLQAIAGEAPEPARRAMLNILGSHDTPRLRTLAEQAAGGAGDARLLQALVLQFTFPGVPCVYYGDEVGLRGEGDPDCRRCFPWDEAAWEQAIHARVTRLGALRRSLPGLRSTAWKTLKADDGLYLFARGEGRDAVAVALNLDDAPRELSFRPGSVGWRKGQKVREELEELGTAGRWKVGGGAWTVELPANGSALWAPERR